MSPKQPSFSNKKRVRMSDVAARCGVSISTVSLVLSGDVRIPEDTTRKVLQTIKAMEYRPNVIARNLARKGSRTIGVILPEVAFSQNQAFYYQALQGIHSQTQSAGFKIIVEATNNVFLERRYYLRLLKEQSADGIIYLAASLQDTFLSEMVNEPYPFVLLGNSISDVSLPTIKINDVLGAKMATAHLISLGHKSIAHVSGLTTFSQGKDRLAGYQEAMKEAKLSVNPSWIFSGQFNIEKAEEAVEGLLAAKVTAVFVGSDEMAVGVLRALHQRKIKVPEQIAVVGMDDIQSASWTWPMLTTVRTFVKEISSMAASFVLKSIQLPAGAKNPLPEIPAPQLIIRGSCGTKI